MTLLSARYLPRMALVLALAAGTGAASAGGTFASDAHEGTAARSASRTGCVSALQGWTEQTMQYFVTGKQAPALPAREVGNAVVYNDFVYNQDNQQVGHAVGYVSVKRQRPDGHLISQYHVSYELPGGQLDVTGNIDRTAVFEGQVARFTFRGTTGSYQGTHGTILWRLLKIPADINTRLSLDMTLCGASR